MLREHEGVKDVAVLVCEEVGDMTSGGLPPGQRRRATESGGIARPARDKTAGIHGASAFVTLEVFPLTPNSKPGSQGAAQADRRGPRLEKAFVAARTPIEIVLADLSGVRFLV